MNRDVGRIRPPEVAAAATVLAALQPNEEVSAALNLVVSRLREVTRADGVVVELHHEGQLVCCYASGHARRWLGRRSPIEGSVGGDCFSRDEPLMSGRVPKDRRFSGSTSSEPEVRSMISIPLQVTGPSVGVVRLLSGTESFFSGHDLVVARLVSASIRRLLVHELREHPEPDAAKSDRVVEALWSLRDRRRSQQRLGQDDEYEVSMLICNITGYLTSEILGHVSILVRDTDHCMRQDAGTYAIVMPGTTADEALVAGARIQKELVAFAAAADDEISVSYEVRTLRAARRSRSA